MKYLLSILFLIIGINVFSQTINPYLGAPSTITLARGFFRSDSGAVVSHNFTDTTSANLGIIKTIPNILIVVNDTLWKRNNAATEWTQVGSGSGGGGSTLTIQFPLTGTSFNGSSPVTIGIPVKTINQNDSTIGGGNISTNIEGYNVIKDTGSGNYYNGFPIPAVIGDVILYFYKSSTTHAGAGPGMLARSQDGNLSIDSTWQLKVGGTLDTVSNYSFGVVASGVHTGRLLVTWRDTNHSSVITHTAYSDDTAKTWTAGNDLTTNISSASFGRIRQIAGDTIVTNIYSAGSADTSFLYYTVDGATWAFFDTLAVGGGRSYNESDLQYLGNNEVIAIARTEAPDIRPSQFYSTDDGHTWTRAGGLNRLQFATQMSPVYVQLFNNKLWLLGNFRDGAGKNSVWWYSYGSIPQAITDTSAWVDRRAYYHPLNDDLGNATTGIDNGYTVPFIYAGKLMVSGYDDSPLETSTGTPKVRAFTIPIVANGDFCKVWASSDQTIPTGTATLVTFGNVDMNDELLFNTDSNFVIFQRDGWYRFSATVTFDSSASGTYRKLYAYLTSPAYTAATFDQPQILSQQKVAGNATDDDFNRLEVGRPYFFRKNEQLRIYVQQDSGGDLKILNSIKEKRATLVVKREID